MSREAWGDEGPEDTGYSDKQVEEIGIACFRKGAQMTREMMARFVEQGGDHVTAGSIRANWNPAWGEDPGRPNGVEYDASRDGFDPMSVN
jgi:hypothetical protein